jgi:uncharacterized repeat protein (TIGR02543 family)
MSLGSLRRRSAVLSLALASVAATVSLLAIGGPTHAAAAPAAAPAAADSAAPTGTPFPSSLHPVGVRNVLVVMVGFNPAGSGVPAGSYAGDGTTQATLNTLLSKTASWYDEVSGHRLTLTPTVYSQWIGVDAHPVAGPGSGLPECEQDGHTLQDAALPVLKASGIDPTTYARVVYYTPKMSPCAGTLGWSDQATTAETSRVFLNGSTTLQTLVHELGHTFGLLHASGIRCPGTGVGPDGCLSLDHYGDYWDAMGVGQPARFGVAAQTQLGWLPTSAIADVPLGPSGPQTFTLSPFDDTLDGSKPEAIRISTTSPQGDERTYWLERRVASGVDSGLPTDATDGLLVHVTQSQPVWGGYFGIAGLPFPTDFGDTALVQARPPANGSSDSSITDPDFNAILPGTPWTSPEGIKVSLDSLQAGGDATVSVTMPPAQKLTVTLDMGGAVGTSGVTSSTGAGCAGPLTSCDLFALQSSTVTLTPVPADRWEFRGWTGACGATSGPCTVTMDQARSVTASFGPMPVLMVNVLTGGGIISSPPGISCEPKCFNTFGSGTTVTLTPVAKPGLVFDQWLGDCSGDAPTCDVVMNGDKSVAALYNEAIASVSIEGQGTVTSDRGGVDCPEACESDSVSGPISFTATPAAGWSFLGWSGACSDTTNPCVASLDDATSDVRLTAIFAQPSPVLHVAVQGQGTVSTVHREISCGATCQSEFLPGTAVTLTATPDADQQFVRWEGACAGSGKSCTLTISADTTTTAVFAPEPVTVAVAVSSGQGTVTSSPAGLDCQTACSASFGSGTDVTLTAHPAAGFRFAGWSGDCSGTATTCALTPTTDSTAAARFEVVTTPPPSGGGGSTPPPPGSGRCTVTGTAGNDVLVGTSGADVICGLGGNDKLKGLGGDDVLLGGAGNDRLSPGSGDDTLRGGGGKDRLLGSAGADRLSGGGQVDTCRSGPGHDRLRSCEKGETGHGRATASAGEGVRAEARSLRAETTGGLAALLAS